MQRLSRAWLAALIGMAEVNCAGAVAPKGDADTISVASEQVSEIIRNGDLSELKPLIGEERITFDSQGFIDQGIVCFLQWNPTCRSNRNQIKDILDNGFFKYYYHLSEYEIVVSYIRISKRQEFYNNPSDFLEHKYLYDYFSCHFKRINSRWLLTESICYSETEGPFAKEPEV